jgi:CBS domain-containing protein
MKVRELMTAAPVAVAPSEPVYEAAKAMRKHGIGAVLVEDKGKLAGLLTDRDIAVRVLAERRDPRQVPVSEVASSEDIVVLGPDDDTDEAARLMADRAVRRIPVVEDGAAIGMISLGDLELTRQDRSPLADVSAAPPTS